MPASHPPALTTENLTVRYRNNIAIENIDFTAPAGRMTAIVGPNGAGKSTLIKAALGLVPASADDCRFFGEKLVYGKTPVAYIPQRSAVDWNFPASALDIVTMGLYRRIGWLRRAGKKYRQQALNCLEQVGLADFAGRPIGQLSGGQQQRVFIARALAQQAELYIMDEPFAGIDAATESVIFDLMRGLREQGKSIVCVHHDLHTAHQYFDHILLLDRVKYAEGPPEQVLSAGNLQKAYGGRLIFMAPGGENGHD